MVCACTTMVRVRHSRFTAWWPWPPYLTPNSLPQVNHLWEDKGDNRHTSLEWTTNADNMAHAVAHGLQSTLGRFEQVYDADEFKKLKAEGMTVSAIARLFNCKRDTVYRLIR